MRGWASLTIWVGGSLEGGSALLSTQHCQQVVAEGVGHVLGPVGVGTLAGDVALHGKALQGGDTAVCGDSSRKWLKC